LPLDVQETRFLALAGASAIACKDRRAAADEQEAACLFLRDLMFCLLNLIARRRIEYTAVYAAPCCSREANDTQEFCWLGIAEDRDQVLTGKKTRSKTNDKYSTDQRESRTRRNDDGHQRRRSGEMMGKI